MLHEVLGDDRHHRPARAGRAPAAPPLERPRLDLPPPVPAPLPASETVPAAGPVPRLVIVLGMSETGLGAMRLLGARGVRCWGVDVALDLPGFRSRHCRRRIHVPTGLTASELTSILRCAVHGTSERPVLLPTADGFVKLLSDARDALRDRFHVALPPADLVDDLLDKQRFSDLAARAGLRTPRSVSVDGLDAVPAAAAAVGFPAVVKLRVPMDKEYSTLPKAIVLRTGADARALAAAGPLGYGARGVVVQEYVPGGDDHHVSVALALDARSRTLATFVSRKRRQGNGGAGVGTFVESHADPEAVRATRLLLERSGYVGVAETELKRHAVTGELFVIEVNPRLWSQVVLPAALGIDFPLLACRIATGAADAEAEPPAAPCAWQDLFSDLYWTFGRGGYFRRGEVSLAGWLRQTLASRAHPYFSWDDPGPALHRAWQGLTRATRAERPQP